jgi:hypothetical protein
VRHPFAGFVKGWIDFIRAPAPIYLIACHRLAGAREICGNGKRLSFSFLKSPARVTHGLSEMSTLHLNICINKDE